MSTRRTTTRTTRFVRRLRYDADGSTVEVIITPNRPTRDPPAIPVTVETASSPEPNMDRFPVTQRFMDTINRAAGMVDEDHPLQNAALALTQLSRRSRVMGSMGMRARPPRVAQIIYDTVEVDSTNTIGETDKCPICITEYKEGEIGGVLPCQHSFHDLCLRTWIDENRTCPLCRLVLN